MGIKICGAPCCWGVDDITNPNLPTYQRVMSEAHEAGYRAIELGPNGWIPMAMIGVRLNFKPMILKALPSC